MRIEAVFSATGNRAVEVALVKLRFAQWSLMKPVTHFFAIFLFFSIGTKCVFGWVHVFLRFTIIFKSTDRFYSNFFFMAFIHNKFLFLAIKMLGCKLRNKNNSSNYFYIFLVLLKIEAKIFWCWAIRGDLIIVK